MKKTQHRNQTHNLLILLRAAEKHFRSVLFSINRFWTFFQKRHRFKSETELAKRLLQSALNCAQR